MEFLTSTILPGLLTGATVTITVTLASLAIAATLGFLLALVREFSGLRLLNFAIDAYVEYLRNIPALSHLFILYFGLASIGFAITSIPAAIIGLGLVGSAVTCDIYRSGFSALGKGQSEAALAVGMTPMQVIWLILSPQAFRVALPPLGNYALQLLKDTSVVSAIAAPEIMFYARSMVTSTFQTTLIYSSAALIYLAMSLPLAWGVARLEKRFGGATDV
jgi:polar amino acid transport system permease protein